jgi:tRNA 5-methylaminomethyl-2-thiouridine biosynthesis bifunctional protein
VRDGLAQAGFAWRSAAGKGGKRDITIATFAPRVRPRAPAARVARPDHARVAIVGGGLAGASCARALAREGLACVVLDASHEPASGASGNAAGLFHGVFHPDDGMHARAHRAAALQAVSTYATAIAGGVAGRCDGLIRLTPEHADTAPLEAELAASGLPPAWLQAWTPQQVQAAGGPACAAWFYPGGGWISPAGLVRAWLDSPGIEWRGGTAVESLEQVAPAGERPLWRLFDAGGKCLAEADAVVFANAADAPRLWSRTHGTAPAAGEPWVTPLARVRGQVSIVAAGTPGLRPPHLPIAGAGYAIALPDGSVLCGATSSENDEAAVERLADHAHNLAQLAAITCSAPGTIGADRPVAETDAAALIAEGRLQGRVGWRATSFDRLPWIGAVPAAPSPAAAPAALPDQPRRWPRVPGLFVATGFGSRGLTWAPLAGRLIASWITGAAYPLPADLIDALDPARFAARAVRAARRPSKRD